VRNLLDISQDTTAFPWTKLTVRSGVSALITVTICLLAGYFSGHESAGAIAAGSAFTVGFAAFHKALSSRLLSIGLCTLGIASATLAGSLAAETTWLVVLVTLIAALNYGLFSSISATAGWVSQQCAVYVIVAGYFKRGLHFAVGRTAMVLLGGGILMLVHVLFDLFRRRSRPESRAEQEPIRKRFDVRIAQLLENLRAQMRLTGETASYTARLVITLLLCTGIYRHFHIRNGYWCPMTALLVLKPQWSATLSRGIARFLGTLAGAGIALLLARTVPFGTPIIFAIIVLCAWGCYALQAVNYAVFSMFITLYIVFLFRFGGFSQTSAAHIRLFNTALGGSLALLLDAAWMGIATRRASQVSAPPKI
jgi:uncharacterized membrane protein YgaE (UPF0421/DUF939 family)